MNAVVIALIVAFTTTVSPLLLAYLTNKQRRQEKLEDYARQDQVAALAAEAARVLKENTEKVAQLSVSANGKLDVIHTLVNSAMTAALQAELDSLVREMVMMKELIALKRVAGRKPSAEANAAIRTIKQSITDLQAVLDERHRQDKLAERQQRVVEAKMANLGVQP